MRNTSCDINLDVCISGTGTPVLSLSYHGHNVNMAKTHSEEEVADAVQQAVQQATDEAYAKGKGEIAEALKGLQQNDRPSGAGGLVQKPPTLAYGEDVARHLILFENYRLITGIKDINAMRVYLTYLDQKCQSKLKNMTKAEKDNWQTSKSVVKKMLIPTEQKYRAKAELKRTRQKVQESVEQFIDRIESLANTVFEEGDEDHEPLPKEAALVDALMNGLRKAEIRIAILSKHGEGVDYADASKLARMLAASFAAAKMAEEEDEKRRESAEAV